MALIIGTIYFGKNDWIPLTTIPVIAVPLSIIVWSAIGSLSAILYRFYHWRRGQVFYEVRWLIARPIFGIVMGCMSYMIAMSGLLLFESTVEFTNAPTNLAHFYLFYVLAFLAGFSDRVFEAIVRVVIGKIFNSEINTEP